MKDTTGSLTASTVLHPRKRPSPHGISSCSHDGAPNAKRSNTQPVASTSSPIRPALRRTQAERELHALLEPEYRDDVRSYMYDLEARTMGSVEFIDMQPELQWYMRPYLIDFLIEVHQQHGLRPETLYLAINIADRYVSKRVVFKKHYQLVGCAALWIAAKFEDAKDHVPTVQELAQACCGAYEESAFVQMEGHVLATVNWIIGHPTAESWLRLACVQPACVEEQAIQHLARFLMEVTLFHRGFIAVKPSDVAAGALLLARFMHGQAGMPRSSRSGITPPIMSVGSAQNALRIAHMLDGHFAEHLDQVSQVLVKKYSPAYFSKASTYAREWYLSGRRYHSVSTPLSTPIKSIASSSPVYARGNASFADMSPSSDCSSSSESEVETDCDFDEPATPITPLSSCSLVNPMDALATTSGSRTLAVSAAATGARSPLSSALDPSDVTAQKENLPRTVSLAKRRLGSVGASGGAPAAAAAASTSTVVDSASIVATEMSPMMMDARPALNDATWEVNAMPMSA